MTEARQGRLRAARDAVAHQREWFAEVQEHSAEGGLVALVNADTPHEILRVFDIPYVVNQWWASVAAAKHGAQRYLDLVAGRGFPRDSEQYNAIGLGSAFDAEPDEGPWGGLPQPFLVLGETTGDTTRKVFDVWADQPGVVSYPLECAASATAGPNWWDDLPHDWERLVGSERIDLLVGELHGLIDLLEHRTGRGMDVDRLQEVMDLGNEQAEWNRRTRDLIARTTPCPVSVNDSIPAVMLPQWHRGSEWARDAAHALYDEVEERIAAGSAVARPERARLMWIGRGLWFDLGFYRHFEREHGAVFVWSMYLAIAADGYARYGRDPLRALASRFVGFDERLYVPPASVEWYVNEARRHRVDGVVHLVSDDARGPWATTRALRAAGIPVVEVHADNADESTYDVTAVRTRVAGWLAAEVL